MRYLSLFTGIGGFEKGIEQAYANISLKKEKERSRQEDEEAVRAGSHQSHNERDQGVAGHSSESQQHADRGADRQPPTCIGYSEVDKYAIQIYQSHFPQHKNYGDITKISADALPDFDLLVGGFPCQAFSIAGLRRGFDDTRGTLFFDIARILRQKQPRLLVLENVKGLLSHDGGTTFKTIIAALTELGYDLQWQVLNSKNFGVPQNRERVLIVGNLRGTPRPEVFPFTENNSEDIVLPTITTRITADSNGTYVGKGSPYKVGTYRTHKDGNGFRESKSGLAPTIPARAREDGSGQPVILQKSADYRKDGSLRKFEDYSPTIRANMGDNHPMVLTRETEDGFHQYRDDPKKSSIQGTHVTYPKGKSHALNTAHVPMTIDEMRIRRLTPMECERLQGFPDDWTKFGSDINVATKVTISDTQRYKTCGNAVTVNVIQAVMERLLD